MKKIIAGIVAISMLLPSAAFAAQPGQDEGERSDQVSAEAIGEMLEPAPVGGSPAPQAPQAEETPAHPPMAERAVDPSDAAIEAGIPIDEDYINSFVDTTKFTMVAPDSTASPSLPSHAPLGDEQFFGVYNQQTGKWTTEGVLNYSYEGMEEVGQAVMEANGDYSEAKQLYLDFNKKKPETQSREPLGDDSDLEKLKAELMTDGMSGEYTLVDSIEVGAEEDFVTLDILSQINAQRGKANGVYLLELISRRKDGSRIELVGKDSGDQMKMPMIEIVSNGVAQPYYAVGDTTVRAGANRTKNDGGDSSLYACESVSSIGLRDMVDENTERILIQFDLRDLVEGQNITSATLRLFGSNIGDEGSNGELVVWEPANASFNENTFTWMSFEHKVFSNYGDTAISWTMPSSAANAAGIGSYRQDVVTAIMNPLISQYQYTGNELYAYNAIVDILSYTTGRGQYADDVSTLRGGVRGQEFHRFVFRLIDSQYMTPEVFTHVMKFYYITGLRLKDDWDHHPQVQTSNWGVTQTSGLFMVLMNMPELSEYDEWLDKGNECFDFLVNESLYEDGACSEVSMGYTSYSMNGLLVTLEYAEELNQEVPMTDFTKHGLLKLAVYLAQMTGPNHVDPQQGNCYNYTGSYMKYFERSVDRFPEYEENEYLRWIVSGGERGKPFPNTSILYPVSKKVMMRSGWGDDDLYLQTNVDGGVKQHGHEDDLATNIFAYGRYLLIDPRYNNYNNDDPYRIWYNSTEGHNTVVINDMTQKGNPFSFSEKNIPKGGQRGNIHNWESNDSYDFFTGETVNFKNYPSGYTKGYGYNFQHTRNILFVKPGFWIVSDYAGPENAKAQGQENNYRQLWHVLPQANMTDEQLTVTDTTITARTNFDDVNMQMVIANDGTITPELRDGYYAEGGSNIPVKYVSYGKTKTGSATFDTLLRPEHAGNAADIEAEKLVLEGVEDEGATASRFVIDEKNGKTTDIDYYIVHDLAQQVKRQFGEYETDGSLAYVEKTAGRMSRWILRDTAQMSAAGAESPLFYATQAVGDLSIEFSGDTVFMETMENINLETLTFATANKPAAVKLNGESVKFKMSGQYVYFGDEPPIDDPEPPIPTTTPTPPPSGGGNGSGGGSHGGGSGGGSVLVPPVVTPAPSPSPTPTTPALSDGMKQELEGHWGAAEITEMVEKGIVNGVTQDSLGLKNQTTRAEFITMLTRALGIEPAEYGGEFTDVDASDWFAPYLAAAKAAGLMDGDELGAANPQGVMTREEMAKLLASACEKRELIPESPPGEFADGGEISEWAASAVDTVTALGLMGGVGDGAFDPRGDALREQSIVVIARLLKLLE